VTPLDYFAAGAVIFDTFCWSHRSVYGGPDIRAALCPPGSRSSLAYLAKSRWLIGLVLLPWLVRVPASDLAADAACTCRWLPSPRAPA
jgi:hypothetical protein